MKQLTTETYDASQGIKELYEFLSNKPNFDFTDISSITKQYHNMKLSDKTFQKFLTDTSVPQKTLENYQQWATNVKELGTSFETATPKASALGAASKAASISLGLVAGAVISIGLDYLVTSIDNYIHHVERAEEYTKEIQEQINGMNSSLTKKKNLILDTLMNLLAYPKTSTNGSPFVPRWKGDPS